MRPKSEPFKFYVKEYLVIVGCVRSVWRKLQCTNNVLSELRGEETRLCEKESLGRELKSRLPQMCNYCMPIIWIANSSHNSPVFSKITTELEPLQCQNWVSWRHDTQTKCNYKDWTCGLEFRCDVSSHSSVPDSSTCTYYSRKHIYTEICELVTEIWNWCKCRV
jgi:hypothetical protein